MNKMEINGDLGGNTNSPKSRDQQRSYWSFTFNNYSNVERLETILQHECTWYVFQEEIGESKTPHLQGTIYLKNRKRLTELKKIDHRIHWEPTKCVSASIAYCTKKESNNGKIYSHGIELPKELELDEPYGWQLKITDLIKSKPDKRTIHWFYEEKGNMGKTTLCKYLVAKHNALMLTGKSSDMYHMISKFPNKRELFVVDIPRSSQDFVNYGSLEQIKNGLIFSGKYDGCQLVFNCPHVIVFANEKPIISKMSKDRWNIHNINDMTLDNYKISNCEEQ